MTAFHPGMCAWGWLAPQNGPEAVTEFADTGDRRVARIVRSACLVVGGPGAGHDLNIWPFHSAPKASFLLPGSRSAPNSQCRRADYYSESGMLSMLGEQFDSVVFPVLKLLYRLPDEEWLDTGSLMSSLGADAGESGTSIWDVFIIESTARLMKTLSDFGAADVDWGTRQWRSDHAAATMLFAGSSPAKPDYRMRLTPLGRYGIRNILVSEGHTARAAGDLAAADAATLLDALPDYEPRGFRRRAQRMAGLPR